MVSFSHTVGKRRPDASQRVPTACSVPPAIVSRLGKPRIVAQQRRGVIKLGDQLHLAARQQARHRFDLCLLGACLVTSVSLVASCKKWTCPPDNHPRTFDMSGDILACLGHTDWHYFEPCHHHDTLPFFDPLFTAAGVETADQAQLVNNMIPFHLRYRRK